MEMNAANVVRRKIFCGKPSFAGEKMGEKKKRKEREKKKRFSELSTQENTANAVPVTAKKPQSLG